LIEQNERQIEDVTILDLRVGKESAGKPPGMAESEAAIKI
jgi:hypothetical protein